MFEPPLLKCWSWMRSCSFHYSPVHFLFKLHWRGGGGRDNKETKLTKNDTHLSSMFNFVSNLHLNENIITQISWKFYNFTFQAEITAILFFSYNIQEQGIFVLWFILRKRFQNYRSWQPLLGSEVHKTNREATYEICRENVLSLYVLQSENGFCKSHSCEPGTCVYS